MVAGPRLVLAGAALFLIAHHPLAHAQDRRVDPQVLRAIETGVVGPLSLRMGPKPNAAPVILELSAPATPVMLADIQSRGGRLRSAAGQALAFDRFVPAIVDSAAIHALLASPFVRHVRSSPASNHLRPMDHSAALVGLAAARGARPALDSLTGHGTVIADLDSNADVFHPQFFRADAGWFDWIDVDGDGVFTPGVDAVDLDRDGVVGEKDTAVWLEAKTVDLYYGDEVNARSPGFDPAIDWVYLDENGNGQRDYGAARGFDDDDPAFGEPLFVPDDVNRNGRIDVGERFARLGTSKFAKVYVHIEYYADVDRVFERGIDLSALEHEYTGGVYGYSDAMHATAVLSIVAGDVPLVGRRWVGMSPDADLLLGFEVAQDSAKGLTWALGEKPDVMLHEVALWTGEPMDGSDVYSAMVDQSMANGMTHTCPTGNLGGSKKHATVSIGEGASVTAELEVPPIGAQYIQVSLNFRGGSNVNVVLREPGGTEHPITGGSAQSSLSTGAGLYVGYKTSARGTAFWDMLLYGSSGKNIPQGTWTVSLTNGGSSDALLDAYVMDEVSGWGEGVAWDAAIATDASTAGIPAISDSCIAVGAHTGHPSSPSTPWFNMPGAVGAVRYFSGRGPRIDGVQKPDLVAPDNPWSAAPNSLDYDGDIVPHGAVWPFGGTSGATPHVTGVAALMAQAGIRGLDARESLRSSAVVDSLTGAVPNPDYGWGRLNAAVALGAQPQGQAPKVTLTASPAITHVDQLVTLHVSATDPDGDPNEVEAKWDDGYDGTWDVAYGPVEARTVSYVEVGRYATKVRVRDGQGRIDEAVVWIEVTDAPVEPVEPVEPAEAGTDGGTDAGVEGGAQDASVPAGGTSSDDGCGCRVPVGDGRGGMFGMAIVAFLAMASRRRR